MRIYQSSGGEHGPPRRVGRMPSWAFAVLASLLLMVGAVRSAQANTIELTLTSISAGAGLDAGMFLWSYSASVTGNTPGPSSAVIFGDYFAILDVSGQTAATIGRTTLAGTPAGWAYSAPTVTPWTATFGPLASDTPVLNAQWTYTGAGTFFNDALLGTFVLRSTIGAIFPPGGPLHTYGGDDTSAAPGPVVTGTPKTNFAQVSAPGPFGPGTPVPLPAAGFAGMALFGLIGGKRLRQARQA